MPLFLRVTLTVTVSRKQYLLKYDVFTTVVMKIDIFWDITPCSPFKDSRLLVESYRLHLLAKLLFAPLRAYFALFFNLEI
jgi:hypothetical protein